MHSLSTRVKAVVHYENICRSVRKVGKLYGIGKSTVARWIKHGIDDLKVACTRVKRRNRERTKGGGIERELTQALKHNPFMTTDMLVSHLYDLTGDSVSASTIARVRKRLGFRFKAPRRSQQNQAVDPDHPFLKFKNVYCNAIAVDESSFISIDLPRKGWALHDGHVPKPAPKKRERISLILAIDATGVVAYSMRKGSFNSSTYATFLQKLPSGRRIITDNVSFHKSLRAREMAEAHGQELVFTPPYCPWFNPVEFAFSLTKRAYRRARATGNASFVDDVCQVVSNCLCSDDCAAFFRHAQQNLAREQARSLTRSHI